jgi:hypothetical protein
MATPFCALFFMDRFSLDFPFSDRKKSFRAKRGVFF